jgi:hypothetical protein
MSRILTITTLWDAAWSDSNQKHGCPGEHLLADRPGVHYVVTRRIDDVEAAAAVQVHGLAVGPGQRLGAVPQRMDPTGYMSFTPADDPEELAAFSHFMLPGEQLGTVPAAGRAPIVMSEADLDAFIDDHYAEPGDQLQRWEGLDLYRTDSQDADRDAWLAGRFDPTGCQKWAAVIADDRRRGMLSQRFRLVGARLSDDEAMSVDAALPIIAKEEEVRVARRGDPAVPTFVPGDFFIIRRASGQVFVLAMHYTADRHLLGAEVIRPEDHGPYLRQWAEAWPRGRQFAHWRIEHAAELDELIKRRAA